MSGESLNNPDGACAGWHGTITDATPQVAMQTAQRQREAAELSNLAKTIFLSQMSHELRTPLNAVMGFSQLLLMDGSPSQGQRDQLQHIKRAVDWLLEMIADLMDLSKIETGDLALKSEAVDRAPSSPRRWTSSSRPRRQAASAWPTNGPGPRPGCARTAPA